MNILLIKKRQTGIVLVISLIMLLLLTIIGVTAMRVTGLEEKMTGNYRNGALAFQASESALRDAEAWISSRVVEPEWNNTGSNNIWTLNIMDPDDSNSSGWWSERDDAWWQANATVFSGSALSVVRDPRYIIEHKQHIPDTLVIGSGGAAGEGNTYYQVTAKGTGGTTQSQVLLQSITVRRY